MSSWPYFWQFLCRLVVIYHLPPNLPKFYDKERVVGQTFMIFVINTHVLSLHKEWLEDKILIFMTFFEDGRFSVTDAS